MLKSCLGVRLSTPNDLVYIETDLLPIKAFILARQYKFYARFKKSIRNNSRREKIFSILLQNQTSFIQHYEQLISKYSSVDDIIEEFRTQTKERVRENTQKGHSKFCTYAKINPCLTLSSLLDIIHPAVNYITKFRLGSHYLPVETGRWSGLARNERLCGPCGEFEDEKHALFNCSLIDRIGLNLNENLDAIWGQPDIFKLFNRIHIANFV